MNENKREWYFEFKIFGDLVGDAKMPTSLIVTCLDKEESNLFGFKSLSQKQYNKTTWKDFNEDVVLETFDTKFEMIAENKLTEKSIDVLIKVLSGIKKELTQ